MKDDFTKLILEGDGNGNPAEDLDFSFLVRTILEDNIQYPPLFRYCEADYNNIRALETKRLYLSSIGHQNDAFEGLSSIITLKKEYFMDDLAYIKSFSENRDDLTMWGLYADSFKGMCIEYDVNKLKGTTQEHLLYHLFPVAYSNIRKERYNFKSILSAYRAFIEERNASYRYEVDLSDLKNLLPLFLLKSSAWQNENEWRLAATIEHLYSEYEPEENDPEWLAELYKIKFCSSQYIDFDCIKSIILGPKMEDYKKEHLKEIGEALGVSVVETRLSLDKFAIEPKQ